MHFTFANQGQGHMRQLNQVSAGANTAMAGDKRINAPVHEFGEQSHHVRMNARFPLQERADTRYHGCLHGSIAKWLPGARRMAANNVVLQVFQITVIHAPLGHGAESGINAIDDFILVELFQETVGSFNLCKGFFVDFELLTKEDHLLCLL